MRVIHVHVHVHVPLLIHSTAVNIHHSTHLSTALWLSISQLSIISACFSSMSGVQLGCSAISLCASRSSSYRGIRYKTLLQHAETQNINLQSYTYVHTCTCTCMCTCCTYTQFVLNHSQISFHFFMSSN